MGPGQPLQLSRTDHESYTASHCDLSNHWRYRHRYCDTARASRSIAPFDITTYEVAMRRIYAHFCHALPYARETEYHIPAREHAGTTTNRNIRPSTLYCNPTTFIFKPTARLLSGDTFLVPEFPPQQSSYIPTTPAYCTMLSERGTISLLWY